MELGELEYETRRLARRSAWKVHGVVVLLWTALYFFTLGKGLGASGIAGAVATVFGVLLLGYVVITTFVIALVGRSPTVSIVVHLLGLIGFAAWMAAMMEGPPAEDVILEPPSQPPQHCVRVRGLQVREGAPLRAIVALANECDDAITIAGLTVLAEAPGQVHRLTALPGERHVPRAENAEVIVESTDPNSVTNAAGWAWSMSLDLTPTNTMCYATEGSSRHPACAPIGPVEPAPPLP